MNHSPIPNIVETIKDRHITPTPRWIIVSKRAFFWTSLALLGFISAVFLSLAPVDLLDLGPDMLRSLGIRRLPLFLLGTPILWTALFVTSILLGVFAFRNTRHGYRFHTLFIASLLALLAVTFALLAHQTRLNDRLDRAIEERMPGALRNALPPREARWMSPEDGILTGRILETHRSSFTLETMQRDIWNITLTDTTKKGRFVRIEKDFRVIIIGIPTGPNEFEAIFIRPLRQGKDRGKSRANFSEAFPYNTMRGAHDNIIH